MAASTVSTERLHPELPRPGPENYPETNIDDLTPGAKRVRFIGRIVNYGCPSVLVPPGYERLMMRNTPRPGYHLVIVKGNNSAVALNIFSTDMEIAKQLCLGTLVTAWASTVIELNFADGRQDKLPPDVSLMVPINARSTSGSGLFIHNDEERVGEGNESRGRTDLTKLCRAPLGWFQDPEDEDLYVVPCLLDLNTLLDTRREDLEDEPWRQSLVCVVGIWRSAERDSSSNVAEVLVWDASAHCVIRLQNSLACSVDKWVPNKTVLLISNPERCGPEVSHSEGLMMTPKLSLGPGSMIEVDPDVPAAEELRKAAVRELSAIFQSNTLKSTEKYKAERARKGNTLTLMDIEDSIKEDPMNNFTGRLKALITASAILDNWRKGQLCYSDEPTCCGGEPIYSNKPVGVCSRCGKDHPLKINPTILRRLADVSGGISPSELLWSDEAWTQLLFLEVDGGSSRDGWRTLTELGEDDIRDVEDQILYVWITLYVEWSWEVGRLRVVGVEW